MLKKHLRSAALNFSFATAIFIFSNFSAGTIIEIGNIFFENAQRMAGEGMGIFILALQLIFSIVTLLVAFFIMFDGEDKRKGRLHLLVFSNLTIFTLSISSFIAREYLELYWVCISLFFAYFTLSVTLSRTVLVSMFPQGKRMS